MGDYSGVGAIHGWHHGGPGESAVKRRQHFIHVMEVVASQADLLQCVDTVRTTCSLAHLLDGRDEQSNEDGNDRDYYQQLDESESHPPRPAPGFSSTT